MSHGGYAAETAYVHIPASRACVSRSECADGTRTTATVLPSLQKLMVCMMRTRFSVSIGLDFGLDMSERCLVLVTYVCNASTMTKSIPKTAIVRATMVCGKAIIDPKR